MPDAELVTDAAPRDPTQMLDAFLVAAVRPPLRRLGPPAARVVGLFVGLVAATTSLAYVGAHAADAHTPAQLACVVDVEVQAAAGSFETKTCWPKCAFGKGSVPDVPRTCWVRPG